MDKNPQSRALVVHWTGVAASAITCVEPQCSAPTRQRRLAPILEPVVVIGSEDSVILLMQRNLGVDQSRLSQRGRD